MMRPGDAIGWPALAVMLVGFAAFMIALLVARSGRDAQGEGTRRSAWSRVGIIVQGVGIGIASFGPPDVALAPTSPKALIEAAIVALLMASVVALFAWASRTMGRNWSLVARTRDDHDLVTTGPFAWMRHPIYTALFLFMIALAVAFGHSARLIVAVPLYALGTWIRIREEERLLRAMFGPAYDDYARRVRRFVPGVF